MQGVITSCVLVGALTGGGLTRRLGRRPALILTGAIFLIASLAMAFAPGGELLVVARAVLGLAIGFASVVGPMYASEVAPPGVRGTMSSLYQLATAGGMLVAYLVNYALADAGAWRWMLGPARHRRQRCVYGDPDGLFPQWTGRGLGR
jgi:MFS family permease